MQKETSTYLNEVFIQHCRERGLKVTPQRITIYKALAGSTDHPTADFVYRNIHKEHPNISFETVNRTLLKFAETGILDVIESFSGARRFDPNLDSHHHIHCVQCGMIVDFKDEQFNNIQIPKQFKREYKVVSKRVVINVICELCQSK
ncbi:transcriptional repressor [candidate division KSB1 bacterium]|nr:transcriptional repressor [candidate division KSB1 bacterium]